MSDIGEGIGGAIEGGLLARAIEPASGAKGKHPHQPDKCLNCDTELVGAYCHACGQLGHVHRTIGAFMHDLLHGALHFEGKLWRTLPMLALRPGRLTRRYIEGARARFVSPMALFLFAVFLMFAIFQIIGIKAPTDLAATTGLNGANVEQALSRVRDDARKSRDEAAQTLAQMAADDPQRGALEQQVAEAGTALDGLDAIPDFELAKDTGARVNLTGIRWIDEGIGLKWQQNPSLMLYKLQANGYKFSWMLIPLSLPFVWALFLWKRRFAGYDHAIFITYSLCFVTLMFVAVSVLGKVGLSSAWQLTILATVVPLHLFSQLKGAYSLSTFSTIWRFLALSLFIWIIALLFLQLLLILGAY